VPVKLKLGSRRYDENSAVRTGRSFRSHLIPYAIIAVAVVFVLFAAIFTFFYFKYQRVVDDRLNNGPLFASTSQVYAAPREVRIGQKMSATFIAQELRRAGYNSNTELGTFNQSGDSITIKPGPQSYHSTDGATISTQDGQVTGIAAENGVALRAYELEPQLITGLSEDKNRTKRRLVTFSEIPQRMVQAVTAIEDRRFFEHSGVDYYSMAGWVWHDLRGDRRFFGGGSTLTMQLSRGLFLSPERQIKRKLIEVLITFNLEHRFTKQQIFEMYANQINLGQRGSFAINGFGEAAQAFFGKDLKQLDTAQCALLAGLVQSPNRLNPFRHPDRAMARRNLVLDSMVETGALTENEAARAKAEPLRLTSPSIDASEAPYFVDLVHDQIVQRLGDSDTAKGALRIYTSLDPELQQAASEAVAIGMANVDALVRKQHRGESPTNYPQVSLVALNPHTGQVLALVGGRNYGVSQLNHAAAKRPTGSIFKPFVYAAAYASAVDGGVMADGSNFTATSQLYDEPTTFTFDNGRQTYSPHNYREQYHGNVTAIYALAHSLNNATISLGQQVGFENIAALGRASGIVTAKGTPSVALGTYAATPLDMAGAYTVFANGGVHLDPWMLASIRNDRGDVVADFAPTAKQVLDPRAAFLTSSLMEGVMNFGYGVAVRQRGFTAPAAGKTGTSNDAWFAAYSSNLICIVWVGNDDYTDVKLSGAVAAAPIWAEFMNRAIKLPQYSDMRSFTSPSGVNVYRLDKNTNLIADDTCPNDYSAAFLDGTQPASTCSQMGSDQRGLFQKIFGIGESNPAQPQAVPFNGTIHSNPTAPTQVPNTPTASPNPTVAEPPKKKNFFQKLFGGGDKKKKPNQADPSEPQ